MEGVAIVTGSSQGIGRAIAERFARDGLAVVVNSSRTVDEGEALARSLRDAIYVQADVADEAAAKRLVGAAMERWGRIDVVVNNVAAKRIGESLSMRELDPVERLDRQDDAWWQEVLSRNLLGPWYMCRAAAPALIEAKGAIVNIGSSAGIDASMSSVPYSVSKAALHHLTRALAGALAPDVRVNAVAPGVTKTTWADQWEDFSPFIAASPLRRIGTPDEIADAAAFFAYNRYVTGQVLLIDGGRTLG